MTRISTRLPTSARDAAVSGGRRLSPDRLVAYALRAESDDPRTAVHAVEAFDGRSTLTGREFIVAEVAADGLTNRQIAEQLGLSVHTVATHLDKVRDELGLRSRTRIALWVAARRKAKDTS